MTLYDILTLGKGFDCVDYIFDYTIYFENIDKEEQEESKDNYQKFCEHIAKNVDVETFGTNNIAQTTILFVHFNKYIQKKMTAFEKFAEHNCNITPKAYENKTEKVWACLRILDDLIIGNYTEQQYKEFLTLLK